VGNIYYDVASVTQLEDSKVGAPVMCNYHLKSRKRKVKDALPAIYSLCPSDFNLVIFILW
jgi:hypothetical protein